MHTRKHPTAYTFKCVPLIEDGSKNMISHLPGNAFLFLSLIAWVDAIRHKPPRLFSLDASFFEGDLGIATQRNALLLA